MASINKAILIGNLGQTPEIKPTQNGSVARFSIATNKSWKDSNGDKKDKTCWHNIVAFNKLSDFCGRYLEKGQTVFIEGEINNRSWTGDDGVKHYISEIVADKIQFVGSKPKTEAEPEISPPFQPTQMFQPVAVGVNEIADDDVPF